MTNERMPINVADPVAGLPARVPFILTCLLALFSAGSGCALAWAGAAVGASGALFAAVVLVTVALTIFHPDNLEENP